MSETTQYDDLDYRELQEAAKSRDLSAGGSAEEIKARLLEADAADPVDGERQRQRELEADAAAAGTDRAPAKELSRAERAKLPADVQAGLKPKTYTPAEAVAAATEMVHGWARPLDAAAQE